MDCNNAGTLLDAGYNLVEDGSCLNVGTSIAGDPLLEALADNGGDSPTQALQSGSPAMDKGACATTSDQRGISRPQGIFCDIGAYEYVGTTAVSPTLTLTYTLTPTLTLSWQEESANCLFDVYSSTQPYSGYALLVTYLSGLSYDAPAGTVGDVDNHTFYYVTAYACGGVETAVSNTVAEFDFALTPGD